MPEQYDPTKLAFDATTFAESDLGRHYMARLEASKARYLDAAMNDAFSDSYRSHQASKAAVCEAELDWFRTAKTVTTSPQLLQRLKDKLMSRDKAKPEV